MYPLVVGQCSSTSKDVVLSGYRVPKGTQVNPNALKPSNPFLYLLLVLVARSCIGRRIVEMELELGIARMVRNFNIEFNYPTENALQECID
ncbi:hypothetical protein DOY81_011702 [Sarcophaga bullata]|nr:hypothetical protein DOY81_011702 [Sarcophaga bullata]